MTCLENCLQLEFYLIQGWQHSQKRSSETVWQTKIDSCKMSKLNIQNIKIKVLAKLYVNLLQNISEYCLYGHIKTFLGLDYRDASLIMFTLL